MDDNIFNYMNYVEQEQKESIEDGSVDNLNKDFENIIKNDNNSLSKVDDIEKKDGNKKKEKNKKKKNKNIKK